MSIDRRDFIKLGVSQLVLLGVSNKVFADKPAVIRRTTPSILQGATDETNTQFSIVYDAQANIEIFVTNAGELIWYPDEKRPITFSGHPLQITKVYFSKLPPQEKLFLNVMDMATGTLIDQREFKTLSPVNDRAFKFALCSCMNDSNHTAEIWSTMIAQNPDVLFFIGDSVYADAGAPAGADPAHLWKRFCEARMTLEVYHSKKLIPIFATWDDHDFGLNDSNSREYPYVAESQKNFLNFFAQDPAYCRFMIPGPGVSSSFKIGEHLFLLLDDRSFRLEKGATDRYAHWGEAQEKWLLSLMDKTSGPTWLMTGSQVFPAMPMKESVSKDHPQQLAGLLNELRLRTSKVVFISGDVHYSEISQIEKEAVGYSTYELTSSSIHSSNTPGTPWIVPNRRRLVATGARNYILVEAVAHNNGAQFLATSFGIKGDVIFQKQLEV